MMGVECDGRRRACLCQCGMTARASSTPVAVHMQASLWNEVGLAAALCQPRHRLPRCLADLSRAARPPDSGSAGMLVGFVSFARVPRTAPCAACCIATSDRQHGRPLPSSASRREERAAVNPCRIFYCKSILHMIISVDSYINIFIH